MTELSTVKHCLSAYFLLLVFYDGFGVSLTWKFHLEVLDLQYCFTLTLGRHFYAKQLTVHVKYTVYHFVESKPWRYCHVLQAELQLVVLMYCYLLVCVFVSLLLNWCHI